MYVFEKIGKKKIERLNVGTSGMYTYGCMGSLVRKSDIVVILREKRKS